MLRILENKLQIPYIPTVFIRKRLFSFLDKHSLSTMISVTGDPGYGKTTLISSYIRGKNSPAIWYQLDDSDQIPHHFLSYLKTAVFRKKSNDHSCPIVLEEEIEYEFQELLSILSNWSDPLFIVFDNYHLIEQNKEIQNLITQLLQHSSSVITYIIIGNGQRTSFPMTIKLRRRWIELKKEQLSFTKNETEEFFNYIHNNHFLAHEIYSIYDKTQGWVTAMLLYMQAHMKSGDLLNNTNYHLPGTSDIYDYFNDEVMSTLPTETKVFLYKTSLLNELNPTIINQFLQISNTEKILNDLLKMNVFVSKDEQGIIRYHPLFRSYLYENRVNNQTGIVVNNEKDHLKLALIYKDSYQYFSSFSHYVAGKDYFEATQIVRTMEQRYNPDKFMNLILNWLDGIYFQDSIPFDSVFLFRCIPLAILDQLILPIEKHLNILHDQNNHMQLCHLQYCLATIYRYKGEFQKANKLHLNSLDYSVKLNVQSTSVLNLIGISSVFFRNGQYIEAEKVAKKALYYSEKYLLKHCQIYSIWLLAEISIERKQPDIAESLLEPLETLLKDSKEEDARSLYLYFSLSRLKVLKYDYTQSIEYAKHAVNNAIIFGNELDLGGSYMQLGISYLYEKEWEMAKECLNTALTHFEYFEYFRCLVLVYQGKLFECIGNDKSANEKKLELVKICKANQYHFLLNQFNSSQNQLNIKSNQAIVKKQKLSIQVLGNFNITLEGNPIKIKRKSSLQLLQLFIVNRGKKLPKDFLLETIFPNATMESINNQFYVALSILRKALEPQLQSGRHSRFIIQSDNHYLFNCDDLYLDANEFLKLINKDQKSPIDQRVGNLLKAETLFRGNFLEEYPYESFLDKEREKYQLEYVGILRILANYFWDTQDYTKGMEYHEKILLVDPFREEIYIEYINRLLNANFLLQAKNVAIRHIKFIEKELGVNVRVKMNTMFMPYSISI